MDKSRDSKLIESLADHQSGDLWQRLEALPKDLEEPRLTGLAKLIEARIVRDFRAGLDLTTPLQITQTFKVRYASFDLGRDEGYLVSLVQVGMLLEQIVKVSMLGRFRTLVTLAKLRRMGVIEFAERRRR